MEAQVVEDAGGTTEQPIVATDHAEAEASPQHHLASTSETVPPRIAAASSPDAVRGGFGSRAASSNNGKASAAGSEAGLPPLHRQSSNLANRIAAFSSGVAPVRQGITNADEDAITEEEVLHKLETAGRAIGQEKYELPVPLIRSAHQHLVAARDEAARTAKELAELKASRVQHIPPSTWIKREQKYKMDQEKYEHIISQLRQRSEALERELAVLREGSNVRPLEEKIQELEHQLVAAAQEKTQVQSKFHELSIKHRQLIETSPQVATIWNEVLVQQAADGHNAAAMQRLVNFDLRHTTASSPSGRALDAAVVSSPQLPGVSAAAAIYSNSTGHVPVPAGPHYSSSSSKDAAVSGTEQPGPSTPMQQLPSPGGSGQQQQPQQPQTAEERAQALMAAVALEGLSPDASIAALQQLNYDLTMQLGCYQQMVSRLKDAMEQSDLEKAELEAEKMALEMHMVGTASERGSTRGWSSLGFWRRSVGMSTGGPGPLEDLDETGSMADGVGGGMHSLSSSRRSSMDMDGSMLTAAAAAAAISGGGSGSSGSNNGTPTKAGTEGDGTGDEGFGGYHHAAAAQQHHDGQKHAAAAAAASTSSGGGLFAARRQRAAVRAAAAAETLGKEVKELKRQVKTLQDENKYLVNNLVEIKMELAETQSSHDQAKRALVRAMDKEACMDMQVSELRHMLDMATNLNEQYEQQAASSGMASAGAAAAAAAGAVAAAVAGAVAAVAGSTPNSAKAAVAALQSPFGRPELDAPAGGADAGGAAGRDSSSGGVDAAEAAAAIKAAAAAAAAAAEAAAEEEQSSDGAAAGAEGEGESSQPVASFQLSGSSSFADAEEEDAGGSGAGSGSAADSASSIDGPAAAAGEEQAAVVVAVAAAADKQEGSSALPGADKQQQETGEQPKAA